MSYIFIPRSQWPESSMTIRFEEFRQVAVPVGHRTTDSVWWSSSEYGMHAPRAKFAIYDRLSVVVFVGRRSGACTGPAARRRLRTRPLTRRVCAATSNWCLYVQPATTRTASLSSTSSSSSRLSVIIIIIAISGWMSATIVATRTSGL